MTPLPTDYSALWTDYWNQQLADELEDTRSGDYQPEQFYISGRTSKLFPNKEDPSWWALKGPGFVQAWVAWRDNCGMDIWTTPTGEPAIELEAPANRGDLELVQVIDRVFIDQEGDLRILDLKTGSTTPAWPRQLALNNLGLIQQFGRAARWGGFWSARKGAVEWSDLRIYDEDWLWNQVRMAREIRDQQLFVAQPTNLCKSACGVAPYCKAMGGELSLLLDMQPSHKEK